MYIFIYINALYCINSKNSNQLIFNGHVIQQVHVVKYLGVMIDDKLNWVEHINCLISKISSFTGILYRIKNYLPLHCKKSVYFALIHSTLIYCIEVYANVNQSTLKPLLVKCNRLLRVILNKPLRTPLYDLYSPFNILPLDLLFDLHTVKFIHRCLYDSSNVPSITSSWFVRANNVHSHNTRNSNNFFVQSNCNPKSILFYGPLMWAKLPYNFQHNPSLSSFLKYYKQHLLNSLKK